MSFGSEMRDLASELTEEFAGELGLATLHHLTGETYDAETGINSPTWTQHEVNAPVEKIKLGTFSSTGFGSPDYFKDHRQVTIAGSDISIVPATGDIFQPPGSQVGHEVVFVDHDMYEAAFVLHVQRTPKSVPVEE